MLDLCAALLARCQAGEAGWPKAVPGGKPAGLPMPPPAAPSRPPLLPPCCAAPQVALRKQAGLRSDSKLEILAAEKDM